MRFGFSAIHKAVSFDKIHNTELKPHRVGYVIDCVSQQFIEIH